MTIAAIMAQHTVLKATVAASAPCASRWMSVATGYSAAMMMLPRDTMRVMANSTRKILVCVVKKKQSALLKQIIKDVDPNAFTYINKAKEVSGFGFRNNQ